eukprot:3274364-Amphidinium_carterae.1
MKVIGRDVVLKLEWCANKGEHKVLLNPLNMVNSVVPIGFDNKNMFLTHAVRKQATCMTIMVMPAQSWGTMGDCPKFASLMLQQEVNMALQK